MTRASFFARYYHPGNASLVVAGDIGAADAFAMVEELFGEIPAGPPVARVEPPPRTEPARASQLVDRIELPRLYLTWATPPLFAAGDADLDLAADILFAGPHVAVVPAADSRSADGGRRGGGAVVARAGQPVSGGRHRRARQSAPTKSGPRSPKRSYGSRMTGRPRTSSSAAARVRRRLSVPAAVTRRVRRQGRAVERLQRLSRPAGFLRRRSRAVPGGHARFGARCGAAMDRSRARDRSAGRAGDRTRGRA